MSAIPRKRRPIASKQTENPGPLARPTGVGREAAEGIHGVGTTADPCATFVATRMAGRRPSIPRRPGVLMRRMLELNARQHVEEPDETVMIESIEACLECVQVCTACADDSLAETEVANLSKSIRLCLDCAVVCEATRQVVTRQTDRDFDLLRVQLAACIEACRVCSAECQRHADHHEHHRICAEVCHRCEAACDRLAKAVRI